MRTKSLTQVQFAQIIHSFKSNILLLQVFRQTTVWKMAVDFITPSDPNDFFPLLSTTCLPARLGHEVLEQEKSWNVQNRDDPLENDCWKLNASLP